jgi:hypothetical protein
MQKVVGSSPIIRSKRPVKEVIWFSGLLTQLGSHAGSCLHERLVSESQEIRDGSEEEAEAGGRDRKAGQGQEEEDLARQVI